MIWNYLFRIGIVLIAALIGSIISFANLNSWYFSNKVIRSPHSPPSYWFGIIWTTIYILYAWAWCINYDNVKTKYDSIFTISIILNVLWTAVFFGLHSLVLSKVVILLLLAVVIYQATIMWSENSGIATFFMLIYASWVICATGLNFETHIR